jgi:parallel beta helix pectate lyase-like protein
MSRPGWPTNSGSGIILGGVHTGRIEWSAAHDNGWMGTGSVGIWTYDSRHIVIEHNESFNNRTAGTTDGGGFDLDGGVTESVMQYNFSHDNDGAGFGLYQYAGAAPWSGNVVRYNLSRGDGRKNGYAAVQIWNAGTGITGADVVGNVLVASHHNTGVAMSLSSPTQDIHVRNNIFITTEGKTVVSAVSGQQKVLFQDNAYWPPRSQIQWGQAIYHTLEAWQLATNQEPRGVAWRFSEH